MTMDPTTIDEIGRSCFGDEFITRLIESSNNGCQIYSIACTKQRFLDVVRGLMEVGSLKFIAPGADCYVSPENPNPRLTIESKEAHWNVGPDEVVRHLDEHWPVAAVSVHDIEIVEYAYNMPGLIWIRDDGSIYHWNDRR